MNGNQWRFLWFVGLIWLMLLAACTPSQENPPKPSTTPSATLTPTSPAALALPSLTPVPVCNRLEIEIEYHQVQKAPMLEAEFIAEGRIPLTLDSNHKPPKVQGSGSTEVGGGGQAGECVFQYSGTMQYQMEGTLLLDRQPPLLRLSGRRDTPNLDVVPVSGICGGGLLRPIIGEEIGTVELPFQDGSELRWNFQFPTIEGESTWRLYLLCP
mgnify:FL=1